MNDLTQDTQVLVTGGTGFVATHCIIQLLEKGYRVRTTVRSLKRTNEVTDMLKVAGIHSFEKLTFVETDLLSDTNWNKAVEDCTYVLHVASPIYLGIPKDENEMIRPAVEGTLRVLEAARNAGVKRVVMTSNFGAVGYSHTDTSKVITEESWTNPNERGLSTYNKSKVMAEKAAWEFMEREGGKLELSVINPVGIFGPAFTAKLSSGFELLLKILDGSMKAIPNMTLSIVDVRDLVDLHIRAMTNPAANGERFLALSDGVTSLPEIAAFLKSHLGTKGDKISTRKLPDWLVRMAALFSPQAKALAPMLRRYRNASNDKAKKLLGWQPRPKEEALLATADSLFRFNSEEID
ncbi:aldehyde reductase [Emticicia sp. BO119]|uniref:SDR family oxidoreductase n=1 Tax=Emticicia sp. BO119 TaxID=2757768 RepID=UPI0015F0B5C9|nr:aldehyde reductase [Emticicia sp. BO119]MBA4851272.1 aldehyde reductase [Emticicia sp. BO119]